MAGKPDSQPEEGRAETASLARNVVLYTICALVIGIAVWGTEPGWSPSVIQDPKDSYYNLLVQGFQAGQLNLKKEAPAGLTRLANPYDPATHWPYTADVADTSYYKGKLYLYFGVVPVLVLYWPYAELTNEYLPDSVAGLIFCSAGYLTAAALMFGIWRRYFPNVSAWVALAAIFVFGLTIAAQEVEWVRCRVYEVALSSAFAFTMIALAAVWRAFHERKERILCLLLASLAYGLAIGSRPNLLPGAAILLVPLALVWRETRQTGLRSRAAWLVAATFGPITLVGLGLMFYNFLRFDNPFEFGFRYQLTGHDQTTNAAFNLHYFWSNFRYYMWEPVQWIGHRPFVQMTAAWASSWGRFGGGQYYGGILFIGFPLAWLALVTPLAWRDKPADDIFILRSFAISLFLVFAAGAFTLFFFLYANNRYELDFLPALMLLAFIGLLGLESAAGSRRLRFLGRLCWGLLLIYGVIANTCAGFDSYAVANYLAGNVLYNRGLMDAAGERFEKALAFAPQATDTHGGLGNVFFRKGDIEGAIAQYRIALEQRPDFTEAHNNLAYCFLRAGRVDDAIIEYQKAIELSPRTVAYHRDLGNAFLQKGLLDGAIVEFKKVLELQPGSAEDCEHLGNAFFRKGMLNDAIVQYQNAVDIKPDFAEAYNNLGYSLFMTGNVDKAIAQYRKAVEFRPDFAQAYNNLGNAYRGKGIAALAIANYQKAIALQRQFVPAQINLAWMLAAWPDKSLRNGTEALALAEQVNQRSGGQDPAILRVLAAAYAETGHFPEALATARQASSSAVAQSKPELLSEIQSDIKLYQKDSPCRSTMAF